MKRIALAVIATGYLAALILSAVAEDAWRRLAR